MQDDSDAAHKDVNIFCNKNKFPTFPFCGLHTKPNDVRVFSNIKNYYLWIDTKLGNGISAIHQIPCDCVECTCMLDKLWVHGLPPQQ